MTAVLKRSKDRKVANLANKAGLVAVIANTFGLPSGSDWSCPNQTSICGKICYAGKLEKVYKGVREVLMHNYLTLKEASYHRMRDLLDEMIREFEAECDKRGADKVFRIHWDGDFFSHEYTVAWSDVIGTHPAVQFWVYTRVPDSATYLHALDHDNLSLYFSADDDNQQTAASLHSRYGIRIAYLGNTFEDAQQKVRSITGGTAAKCPEQTGQIPLISTAGGACVKCGLCVTNKADIAFSITKK